MILRKISHCYLFFLLLNTTILFADNYPDQHYIMYIDSIFARIETNEGIKLSDDGKCILLEDSLTSGYIVLKPSYAQHPFNRGLPSWNGTAPDENSSFLIQMRFPYAGDWSPWLTVGFWKSYIWNHYGTTSYGGGEVDYDYIKLSAYQNGWQFRIVMKRTSTADSSPTLHKLSFFVSDSRTTNSINYNEILNDNPEEIFIDTEFLYQYAIDNEIGNRICSPTSVSMILLSYGIEVDPLGFARDTQDPYYGIFGIWPRVVQNASEFGLDGAVTRYRSWSQAREVLANGGRIAMSVGEPLYSGHLMMLAGFSDEGNPIVHDPAKYYGYAYQFNKNELSHSWFDKGGIAYTFYLADSLLVPIEQEKYYVSQAANFQLYQNYPNPFNAMTHIAFSLSEISPILVTIYDINGRLIKTIYNQNTQAGNHNIIWNASDLPSGTYFIRLKVKNHQKVIKSILAK